MRSLWRRLSVWAILAVLLGSFLVTSALAEDTDAGKQPVGAPTAKEGHFIFMNYLVAQADDRSTVVMKNYNSFGVMINLLATVLTVGAGIFFFFLILSAGYKLIFSGNKEEALRNVRKQLTTGIIGLLVVLSAYWITKLLIDMTGISSEMSSAKTTSSS